MKTAEGKAAADKAKASKSGWMDRFSRLRKAYDSDVEKGTKGGEGVLLLIETRTEGATRQHTSALVWQLVLTKGIYSSPISNVFFIPYCIYVVLVVGMIEWLHPAIEETGQQFVSIGTFGIIGSVVFLLTGYRLNASYDRWWEGRKIWGAVVNRTRDLSRQSIGWIGPKDWDIVEQLVRWTVALAVTTKRHLRYDSKVDELEGVLNKDDLDDLKTAKHQPNFVMERLTDYLALAHSLGYLTDIQAMALDANVTQFEDDVGKCERILRTSLPFALVTQVRIAIMAWILVFPVVLVTTLGWYTIIAAIIGTYLLLVMEDVGCDIEEPFGTRFNSLPIDVIVTTIQNNLLELLERKRAVHAHPCCVTGVGQHQRSLSGFTPTPDRASAYGKVVRSGVSVTAQPLPHHLQSIQTAVSMEELDMAAHLDDVTRVRVRHEHEQLTRAQSRNITDIEPEVSSAAQVRKQQWEKNNQGAKTDFRKRLASTSAPQVIPEGLNFETADDLQNFLSHTASRQFFPAPNEDSQALAGVEQNVHPRKGDDQV